MNSDAMQERVVTPTYLADLGAQDVPPGCEQYDVGIKAEDWGIVSLCHISDFITKGSTPTTYGFKWEDSGILFLRSECVSSHGLDLDQSMFISPAAHAMLHRSEVRDGDVLMTITGNVGRVVLLRGVGVANINQHIARVRISARDVDHRYVYHVLSQFGFRRKFESITTGQAYPQISLQQVRQARIPLPQLPEQRAIADALSDVDELLGALEALIAKKGAIKQAAMQQLLTGKTRLPGFGGEWERKRLGRCGSTYGGISGKGKSDFGHGPAQYVTFLNVLEPSLKSSPTWTPRSPHSKPAATRPAPSSRA
jgi:restriction endonuclease S subunit